MTRFTTILAAGTALITAFAAGCSESPVPFFVFDDDGHHNGDGSDPDEECDPEFDVPVFAESHMGDPGLRTATGCDEVADLLRQKLLSQMMNAVEANRAYLLAQKAKPVGDCWDYSDSDTDMDADTDTDVDTDGDMDTDGDSDGAEEYSTTNNQVEGVDEPDFVKNDGNTIFLLADGRFQVLDAWPAEEAHRISATAIEGEPKKMFVLGDRAVVYSSLDPVWTGDSAYDSAAYGECTYGYDCELMGDGRPLRITVLDISDLTSPIAVREIELSGSLLAGRSIDGTTYTMVVFPQSQGSEILSVMQYAPGVLYSYWGQCGSDIPFTQCEIQQMFDDLIEYNAAMIAALSPEVVLPSATDRRLVGDEWIETTDLFAGCAGFYLGESGDGMNQLTLLTFDPSADDALELVSIIDRPGAVYASAESLYVAPRHYAGYGDEWYFDDPYATPEATTVHKFALDPAAMTAEYRGSGAVKGRVLNQFSMDEHDRFLRIATTTGWTGDSGAHSTVSVLSETGGALATVGQADHIAPEEDIRAVRLQGDRGYVVTFLQTDPLFVLDLSNAESPTIVGELEIPGFSTYMRSMDANHLLTIGYDTSADGVLLQIFDVTDPTAPLQDHVTTIGTYGSSSEAMTNHLAFNYFPSRDLLAIPMTRCEYWEDGETYDYGMTFSGLSVFSVTAEGGFSELGGVPHADPVVGDDYWEVCGDWWTNPNTAVKRSVFMEDYVFSIAPDLINVASVSALGDVLVSLDLTAP